MLDYVLLNVIHAGGRLTTWRIRIRTDFWISPNVAIAIHPARDGVCCETLKAGVLGSANLLSIAVSAHDECVAKLKHRIVVSAQLNMKTIADLNHIPSNVGARRHYLPPISLIGHHGVRGVIPLLIDLRYESCSGEPRSISTPCRNTGFYATVFWWSAEPGAHSPTFRHPANNKK